MGVISNIYTISAYILIVHYGTAYADKYCYKSVFDSYECPDDTWCCDLGWERCCSYTYTNTHTTTTNTDYRDAVFFFLTATLIALVVFCCCCLLCCCCRRRRNGVVYGSGATTTVVSLPPQTPQGYPSYPPAQPPYPTNEGYNPNYSIPPPENHSTAPNLHTVTVVPVASVPPSNVSG